MPRKKQKSTETKEPARAEASDAATAVASPAPDAAASNTTVSDDQPEGRTWANPYKAIVTANGFEMGENHRFKQRVFMFREKPPAEVLATLKENGFTYRGHENAWTIPANPDTRRLSDELAVQFGGLSKGPAR